MEKEKFKWGIIGPGRIANKFAEGITGIENAEIFAIASRNKERANNFANKYGIKKIYLSYEELVNNKDVDAIYISTPHRFHFEQVLLALNAGKPVLCEKPLTVNSTQSKILVETARKNNLFLMEAVWTRFLPIYNVVRSWLDENLIGDVKLLNSTFGINFPRNLEDRKFNHELAGGGLLDLGVYNIAISQWVMKQNPTKVSAIGYLGKTNVDELLAVNLQYESGAVSQFSCNLLSKNENDFIIYGSKGYIRIHNMFWGATKATLYVDDKETTESQPFRASGFEYEIEEAMNCIQAGKLESSIMPLDQTLANMELMDKIRKEIGLKYSFE
ncbi:MAG: Gfo/Idh/MocA family oxidoreductase [Ignavibacteriae bacterium]|nr:Gfo/Idh/MocA family oxidoreductase [Ignavibacteriota bacterium]